MSDAQPDAPHLVPVPDPPTAAPSLAAGETSAGFGRLVLGLGVLAADTVGTLLPEPIAPSTSRLVELGVGSAVGGAERLVGTVRGGLAVAGRAAPWAGWVAGVPLAAPFRRRVDELLDATAARGRMELEASRELAAAVISDGIARAVRSPVVDAVVGETTDVLLPAVIDAVLPVALDRLTADPAALLAVVEGVIGPILDAALPDVLDRLRHDPTRVLAFVEVLLPPILEEVLPLALTRLAEEPDQLRAVVQPLAPGLVDDVLPVALGALGRHDDAVVGLVDELLPVLLPELLEAVLPAALERLADEPEVVRTLVLDQSGGLAGELADTVRSRTVTADDVVERLVRRLTLRKPRARPELPSGLTPELGDGGPR